MHLAFLCIVVLSEFCRTMLHLTLQVFLRMNRSSEMMLSSSHQCSHRSVAKQVYRQAKRYNDWSLPFCLALASLYKWVAYLYV